MPGSRANIDHIAVTPSGIWVIDAKRYSGKVEKRDVGGWFRKDERLFVAGRDQTRLIDGVARQVQAVRAGLEDARGPSGRVRAILCFVGAEWSLFARPFTLNETLITWPASLIGLLESEGALSATEIQTISSSLADRLRPA